jgi:hypothetical protein
MEIEMGSEIYYIIFYSYRSAATPPPREITPKKSVCVSVFPHPTRCSNPLF